MNNEHALTIWRKENGKSQDDVARDLGVTRWMINRLENGKRNPSLSLALKLQSLTGGTVRPEDFGPAKHPEPAGAAR